MVPFFFRTTILGYKFSAPFFIAPAATAGYTNPLGELSLATAAGKENLLYVVRNFPLFLLSF